MGNPFTEAVGNVLTKLMGNVLTEILGKVLDIYYLDIFHHLIFARMAHRTPKNHQRKCHLIRSNQFG